MLKLSKKSIKIYMHIYISINIIMHKMGFWERSMMMFKYVHMVLLKYQSRRLLRKIFSFLKIVALVETCS